MQCSYTYSFLSAFHPSVPPPSLSGVPNTSFMKVVLKKNALIGQRQGTIDLICNTEQQEVFHTKDWTQGNLGSKVWMPLLTIQGIVLARHLFHIHANLNAFFNIPDNPHIMNIQFQ